MGNSKMIASALTAPPIAPDVGRETDEPLKHRMLAWRHRLVQANRNEYSQIQEIGRRMGLDADKIELWGARTLAATTLNGSATPSEVVHAFKLGEASQLLKRATLTPAQMTHLRQLASEVKPNDPKAAQRVRQAEQQREQQVNQPRLTSQSQPAQQPQQGPASRSVGGGPLVQPWSEDRIRTAVAKLAKDNNITNPVYIRLMEDMLINPERSTADRAKALTDTSKSGREKIVKAGVFIRERLGLGLNDSRESLARKLGMTPSELVARVEVPNHPGLAQRVISAIPETRRDDVAKVLLSTYKSGTDRTFGMYRALETIFTDDIWGTSPYENSITLLQNAFGNNRLTMLRNMGFSNEQILSMNPVGKALIERLEPRLGTYSGAELARRKEMGLPTTREEAANLLLTARERAPAGKSEGTRLNYRAWLAIVMISKNPTYTSNDLESAYLRVKPNATPLAANRDLSLAFRIVENHYGISIERGIRNDLQGREYQEDNNTRMLQAYGLGRTSLKTGRLEPIPTDFKPRSNPSPSTESAGREQGVKPAQSTDENTTWRDLLPLLQTPAAQK